MIYGNTSDFIDCPLHKHFVSAHGASHHAGTPGTLSSKAGAGLPDSLLVLWNFGSVPKQSI